MIFKTLMGAPPMLLGALLVVFAFASDADVVSADVIDIPTSANTETSTTSTRETSTPSPLSEEVPQRKLPSGTMQILVTGGAGFIGTHTVVELLEAGHVVTVLDDCSNTAPPSRAGGMPPSLERVKSIVGPLASGRLSFVLGDVTSPSDLDFVFRGHGGHKDAVIHFAGLKAVGESKEKPLSYYRVNQGGSVALLEAMDRANCTKIIFSSSATVYQPARSLADLPLAEVSPIGGTTNPYARSKLHVEEILQDASIANENLSVVNLRYFNPVGAHPSGLIGEDPRGIPNNLMPFVSQVAIGRRDHLNVFGDDYPTKDGTGMRDYIHVVDLAKGHLAAMKRFTTKGFTTYNLGTGQGTSVLELVAAFREASGRQIPTVTTVRRPGDVAWLWCSPDKALKELDWRATRNITDMCRDMWKFQAMNPTGYVTVDPELMESTELSSDQSMTSDSDSEEEKRSDSGVSSDDDTSSAIPMKNMFLHFMKKSTPAPTHDGPRDL